MQEMAIIESYIIFLIFDSSEVTSQNCMVTVNSQEYNIIIQ